MSGFPADVRVSNWLLLICVQVITAVTVTDADSDPVNQQVEYYIKPSPYAYLFRLESAGQICDIILTDQLDADNTNNISIMSVVYRINVRKVSPRAPSYVV